MCSAACSFGDFKDFPYTEFVVEQSNIWCFLLQEEGVNITANSLHPGAIATNLLRHHGLIEGNRRLWPTWKWQIFFSATSVPLVLPRLFE